MQRIPSKAPGRFPLCAFYEPSSVYPACLLGSANILHTATPPSGFPRSLSCHLCESSRELRPHPAVAPSPQRPPQGAPRRPAQRTRVLSTRRVSWPLSQDLQFPGKHPPVPAGGWLLKAEGAGSGLHQVCRGELGSASQELPEGQTAAPVPGHSASESWALSSRLPPPRPRLASVDPMWVTLELMGGLLVTGDVHQLQVCRGEEQTVEVLPVHLPAILLLDGIGQCGHNGALLLYAVSKDTVGRRSRGVQVPSPDRGTARTLNKVKSLASHLSPASQGALCWPFCSSEIKSQPGFEY